MQQCKTRIFKYIEIHNFSLTKTASKVDIELLKFKSIQNLMVPTIYFLAQEFRISFFLDSILWYN